MSEIYQEKQSHRLISQANAPRVIPQDPSRVVLDFVKSAEIQSLAEIAARSALLFGEQVFNKDTSLLRFSALVLAVGVYHDPNYSAMQDKRRQILQLLNEIDGSAGTWGAFKRVIGDVLRSDFSLTARSAFSGVASLPEIVLSVFGPAFVGEALAASAKRHETRIESNFDDKAKIAIQTVQDRIVQARIREEIFREYPEISAEFALMVSGEYPADDIDAKQSNRPYKQRYS